MADSFGTITRNLYDKILRIVRKVDVGIRAGWGIKITNQADSLLIAADQDAILASIKKNIATAPPPVMRVKVSSALAGSGIYSGRVLGNYGTDITGAADLTQAMLGADPGAENAIILNMQELGHASSHDLTDGTCDILNFNGTLVRINSNGKFVIAINGLYIGC